MREKVLLKSSFFESASLGYLIVNRKPVKLAVANRIQSLTEQLRTNNMTGVFRSGATAVISGGASGMSDTTKVR